MVMNFLSPNPAMNLTSEQRKKSMPLGRNCFGEGTSLSLRLRQSNYGGMNIKNTGTIIEVDILQGE